MREPRRSEFDSDEHYNDASDAYESEMESRFERSREEKAEQLITVRMTREDLAYIAGRIRIEFDRWDFFTSPEKQQRFIEMAERFGLTALANEMRNDMKYPPKK